MSRSVVVHRRRTRARSCVLATSVPSRLPASTRCPRAATWTAPLTVGRADPNTAADEDVAMDASGAVGFVWTSRGVVRAAMRSSGGGFGETATLGQGATSAPTVALDSAAGGLAVWSRGGTLAAATGNAAGGGLTSIPDLAAGVAGAPTSPSSAAVVRSSSGRERTEPSTRSSATPVAASRPSASSRRASAMRRRASRRTATAPSSPGSRRRPLARRGRPACAALRGPRDRLRSTGGDRYRSCPEHRRASRRRGSTSPAPRRRSRPPAPPTSTHRSCTSSLGPATSGSRAPCTRARRPAAGVPRSRSRRSTPW
jgi:hypothetical protein